MTPFLGMILGFLGLILGLRNLAPNLLFMNGELCFILYLRNLEIRLHYSFFLNSNE